MERSHKKIMTSPSPGLCWCSSKPKWQAKRREGVKTIHITHRHGDEHRHEHIYLHDDGHAKGLAPWLRGFTFVRGECLTAARPQQQERDHGEKQEDEVEERESRPGSGNQSQDQDQDQGKAEDCKEHSVVSKIHKPGERESRLIDGRFE
ncbi:uncharacterized protein ARB_05585 [Trichophyton benhamiae CBS 112371]|uniref:Uncharacterized protein n=1 Tax=Arthroderma benhamiae (strain ATCC MYA-4681 / CBS 112371) TaxID=663331 RepID=D4AMY2_ARTBC|nr:uncharacterized protein ARB_05585 [Trichophyton benhamiae CBS 112371]EFE35543.1 hypothetical protein ARB_05585 [Trichophyton benhamiae CBS 112371]